MSKRWGVKEGGAHGLGEEGPLDWRQTWGMTGWGKGWEWRGREEGPLAQFLLGLFLDDNVAVF